MFLLCFNAILMGFPPENFGLALVVYATDLAPISKKNSTSIHAEDLSCRYGSHQHNDAVV